MTFPKELLIRKPTYRQNPKATSEVLEHQHLVHLELLTLQGSFPDSTRVEWWRNMPSLLGV